VKAIVLCLLSACALAGCAGTVKSSDDLKNQGYQKSNIVRTTAAGETRAQEWYELWWKESRERGRVVNFCIVPLKPNAGYQWAISLFVDDRKVWEYDGGYSLPGRAGLRTGVDCADSTGVPEGRLNWWVSFKYWH